MILLGIKRRTRVHVSQDRMDPERVRQCPGSIDDSLQYQTGVAYQYRHLLATLFGYTNTITILGEVRWLVHSFGMKQIIHEKASLTD